MTGYPGAHDQVIHRSWLLREVPQADEEDEQAALEDGKKEHDPELQLQPAPQTMMGTAFETRHRVLQVSVGAEHGVLLNDAGIAFTWGDNRYGQLGRPVQKKEEGGEPFPVLDLLQYEVIQVAAGTHHCLALTAFLKKGPEPDTDKEPRGQLAGAVWAWGRNKNGQLGTGDVRDSVKPVPVKAAHSEGRASVNQSQDSQLGADTDPDGQIITIDAGFNSSTAVAKNSDVWHWGEIAETGKVLGARAGREHCLPKKIFERSKFKRFARSEDHHVSISLTGCRVKVSEEKRDKTIGSLKMVKHYQHLLIDARQTLNTKAKTPKEGEEEAEHDAEGFNSLQDTIGTLEREIMLISRNIELLETNIRSCQLQQDHNRKQIDLLVGQGTVLSNRRDEVSVKLLGVSKGSNERRKLDEELEQINEFVEANQNTRMTLLDQRADTDKEKQDLLHKKGQQQTEKDMLHKRLETVKQLVRTAGATAAGPGDALLNTLKFQCGRIAEHFEKRNKEAKAAEKRAKTATADKKVVEGQPHFETIMHDLETDHRFLDEIETTMRHCLKNAEHDEHKLQKAQIVQALLQDLVDMRRTLIHLKHKQFSNLMVDCKPLLSEPPPPDTKPQPGFLSLLM